MTGRGFCFLGLCSAFCKAWLLTVALLVGSTWSDAVHSTEPDPQIEALLARMTVDEKVGQLTLLADELRPGQIRASIPKPIAGRPRNCSRKSAPAALAPCSTASA